MRKVYAFLAVITMTFCTYAQAPEKLSYQAVVRDANGELVKSSSVGMRISILQGSTTGTAIYVETQTPATNLNGLFTLEIGGGTPVTGTFAGIDWSTGTYFIKTETDPTGGTNYTITGTSQMLSVPYSFFAKTSGKDDGLKQQIKVLEDNLIQQGNYKLADIDGNLYNVVKIGIQIWMKENLKTTKYNDGSPIPLVKDSDTWSTLRTPGFCWYNNDVLNYNDDYGALYNFYAVREKLNGNKNICPIGWRMPTASECMTLISYASGNLLGGLKETGTTHWQSPNSDATNETGFTALPAGARLVTGGFGGIGSSTSFWSSSEWVHSDGTAFLWSFGSNVGNMGYGYSDSRIGASVRCLKDGVLDFPKITTQTVTSITGTTAISGGYVSTEVIVRGVCWSTSPNPTIANSHSSDESSTSMFNSNLTGLTPNTLYYVKAYAKNSVGIGYGNQVSFTTLSE